MSSAEQPSASRAGRRPVKGTVVCLLALLLGGAVAPVAAATQTFPGGNGRIVFVRDGDIWTMTEHGEDETRLTSGADDDTSPAVSPDGTTVAFVRVEAPYRAAIFTVRLDGTGLTDLTGFDGASLWPRFSPDGDRILYSWADGEDAGEVRVMDRDGRNAETLTGSGANGDAVWSPSGRRIAYVSSLGDAPGLYVMRADGSGERRIVNVPLSSVEAWGPARRIVYTTSNGRLVSIRPNGTGKRLLVGAYDSWNHDASYSPDGTRLAFQRCHRTECRFLVIEPDAMYLWLSKLTRPSDGPTWSPDGWSLVAPFFRRARHSWDLRLLTSDGPAVWLTAGGGVRDGAAWASLPIDQEGSG